MSLQSLLSIARSALQTHQQAMNITGHNVANANTPGYTKQRLVIQAETPLGGPLFPVGRGITAVAIQRTRNDFYDSTFRSGTGDLGRSSTMHDYLGQVETALNEPSSTGLSSTMDGLFHSLSDLSNDPASRPNRDLVVAAANRLIQQFHGLDAQVKAVGQQAYTDMSTQADQVNAIAQRIGSLNAQIQAMGGANHSAPDLQDQRDQLIDQLSQFVGVRAVLKSDGTASVIAGDTMLVDGAQVTGIRVAAAASGPGYAIVTKTGNVPIDVVSGSLKGLVDLTQTKLPDVQTKLDQLASAFVIEFNNVHRTGTTLSGTTNIDFFDPGKVTAGGISLSAQVAASSDNIAASATGASGNGAIAAQLAAFATTTSGVLGNNSMREFFVSLASRVGLDVQGSQQDSDAHQTTADQADSARNSVSGVNVDEEMISLMSEQQAYQAAARLVKVADEMIQVMLGIGA